MKNTIKASILAASVLAMASVGAFAQNSTTATIALRATVSSFDNIACTQTAGGISFGENIVNSGQTAGQQINCTVTTNDPTPMDVTAYVPHANPLTGSNSNATIPNSDILWSASSGGTYTPFAALTATGYTDDDGAIVATSVAVGDATPVTFYLALNVPAGQVADSYSATLTVAITPHAS